MDLSGRTVWQQAAGDTDREYVDLCLKWGVILNGPGYAGAWPSCVPRLRSDKISARKITDLKRFAEEMKDGDLVTLRTGTSTVWAVGQVVDGYDWWDEFGDVDGWALQHTRRVRWLWKAAGDAKTFGTYAMKQGGYHPAIGPGTRYRLARDSRDPVRDRRSPRSSLGHGGR